MKRFAQIAAIGCLAAAPFLACGQAGDLPIDDLNLPEGFQISVYAETPGARELAMSDAGILFVGNRRGSHVYAVVDRDGDGSPESTLNIGSDLRDPNSVAYRDGDLYVVDEGRLLRYDDIETRLEDPPEPIVLIDDLPDYRYHDRHYIDFGPDGRLYMAVGAPCNVCEEPEPFATIVSMQPDGSDRRIVAYGVRNSVGFAWHPVTGDFWFTDNGRDMMGDNLPPCELNRLPEPGAHFGFPYVHGTAILDPEFGRGADPADYVSPAQELGPHVAPLGLEFYDGGSFPAGYRHQALIAEHGSWNRSEKIGYRITIVRFDDDGNAVSYEPFIDGWLQGEEAWGRPVDLEITPDGSLLISDDGAGVIYRVTYAD